MPVLIIGDEERAAIAKVIADAKAHVLPLDVVKQGIADGRTTLSLDQRNRMRPDFIRPKSAHVVFMHGYQAAFSFEEQPPGLCSHLSISVQGRSERGKMPGVEAVKMIAEAFAVPFPGDKAWVEEYKPGEYAVNLVSLVESK
jgi:hypothetical protein